MGMIKIIRNFKLPIYYAVIVFFVVPFAACKSTRPVATVPVKTETPVVPKKEPVKPPVQEVKKDEPVKLKIVVIMPFGLTENFREEVEGEDVEITQASMSAIHFYGGAKLAADSLKKNKAEISIFAYDTPGDSASLARMMSNFAIKDADYVIGTFPSNMVSAAASLAKINGERLILTQSPNTTVLEGNPNTAVAYASTVSQCREMVDFVLDNYPDANVLLVFRNTRREDELAAIYRDEIKIKNRFATEFNATDKNTEDLLPLLIPDKPNVMFLVSSGEAFVSPILSFMDTLNIPGIVVAGLPTWKEFESIDFMSFKNIKVSIFENNFIDYSDEKVKAFRKKFLSVYHTDPLPAAYNGFDWVFTLGKSPSKKDKSLNDLIKEIFPANDMYRFIEHSPGGGLENKSISVLEFREHQLHKLNK
jgi:hypothetical protein